MLCSLSGKGQDKTCSRWTSPNFYPSDHFLINKCQLCQEKEQQALPIRDWIKPTYVFQHSSAWSTKHPSESWGRGGGEQQGVTTINPSGNPSNRTQDEHPINFFSLKSYLGNWLVRCGVTTMWLSYHFERKVLEYALSLSWETSHCNCKPELENSLSCWFQLISPKLSPIVASCLPKWQDDSLYPNTSLKAHTFVKTLQVSSVFKCSPWFTRRRAAAVREQYRCKEQPATMKPGSNHILGLPGFICW